MFSFIAFATVKIQSYEEAKLLVVRAHAFPIVIASQFFGYSSVYERGRA